VSTRWATGSNLKGRMFGPLDLAWHGMASGLDDLWQWNGMDVL
jgi:hypothetical protein